MSAPARLPAAAAALLLTACAGGGVAPIRSHFDKGVYHYSNGDVDAAAAEYRRAIEIDSGDLSARFNLAVTLEDQAERLAAEGDPASVERGEEAAALYRSILERSPRHAPATVNLAALEREAGDEAAARRRLEAYLDGSAGELQVRLALAAHLLQDAAAAVPDAQEPLFAAAEEELRAVLARDRTHVTANVLLGDLLRARGDEEGARARYRTALDREPADVGTLLALGRLDLEAGRPADAAESFERATYVNPELWEPHLRLSEAREATGDLEGAVLHLWAARDRDHRRPPAVARPDYAARLAALYGSLLRQESGPD